MSPDRLIVRSVFLVMAALASLFAQERAALDDGTEALLASLMDDQVPPETRIERILKEARPGNLAAVRALVRVMKDRSQAAFLLENDAQAPFGYRAVEFKDIGPDTRPNERIAAICALEAIGSTRALPDLLLALDDRHAVVQNHAARALLRFGNRSGIECLLFHLEAKTFPLGEELASPAFGGETANRILREITGEDFGFNADGGLAARLEAAAKWRQYLAGIETSGQSLRLEGKPCQEGADAETDRKFRFFVDMLGQHQFLYYEQARRALRRFGVPALSFLRGGIESARRAMAKGEKTGGNASTLADIVQVLESIRHPNSRQLLIDLVNDAPSATRARAVSALVGQRGRESLAAIQGSLADKDPAVALAAGTALGSLAFEAPELASMCLASLEKFDDRGDRQFTEARLLALFLASRGKRHAAEVLDLLLADLVSTRNLAYETIVKVTGKPIPFVAVAALPDRKKVADAYRALLGG